MTNKRRRRSWLVGGAAALLWSAAASAQIIFPWERPITPAAPPPPAASRAARPPVEESRPVAKPRPKPKPVAAKPVVNEPPSGRDLLLNGSSGRMRIERLGKTDYTARLTLKGAMISAPDKACVVELGTPEPLALKSLGRPAGLARFAIEAPACPISFDVVDDTALVDAPAAACVFQQADCRVDPRGLWGPDGRSLGGRIREIERERGRAEAAVRDTFREILARAKGLEVRTMAAEQAGFSSERQTTCRTYVSENAHGFCATKLTEARAAALRAKLATLAPAAAERKARPARKREPSAERAAPSAATPAQIQ